MTTLPDNIRQLAKKILTVDMQKSVKKNLHKTGMYTWPTKSYETWLTLQSLLFLIRPQRLVEFGSGRSTNYLAEYALKFKAELISFEQNLSFCLKVNKALKLGFLPTGVVKHAPIKGDWYDVDVINRYLDSFGTFDFLFIDGPAEFNFGKRDSRGFDESVLPRLDQVKMIVVDDVDCADCNELALFLAQKFNLTRFDIPYNERNILAFLLSEESSQKIRELPSYLADLLTCVKGTAEGAGQ